MKSKSTVHLPTHFIKHHRHENLKMEVQLHSFLALVSGQLRATAALILTPTVQAGNLQNQAEQEKALDQSNFSLLQNTIITLTDTNEH
jgi:hypothetical protein